MGGIRLRNRRGAVLVWFGLSVVALLMVTAVTLDFSYWYAVQAEMQSAADAAALRGAMRLQRTTADDRQADVAAAVVTWNDEVQPRVQGRPATLTTDQVRLAFWTPTAPEGVPPEPDFDLTGREANAVVVEHTVLGEPLIGHIFEFARPQLRRRAVAWIANVNGAECLKPWGFPMSEIKKLASGGTNSTPAELTPTEIAALAAMTPAQRTMVVGPPKKIDPEPTPHGNWDALVWGDPNNGVNGYQHNIGGACLSDPLMAGTKSETDFPGNNVEDKTTEMVTGNGKGNLKDYPPVCHFKGARDATCYASAGAATAGVRVVVPYATSTVHNGKEPVTVWMLGEFVIQCYVRAGDNACGWSPYNDVSDFTEGTMVGYLIPNFHSKFAPGVEYGNTPSTSQRLLLVR